MDSKKSDQKVESARRIAQQAARLREELDQSEREERQRQQKVAASRQVIEHDLKTLNSRIKALSNLNNEKELKRSQFLLGELVVRARPELSQGPASVLISLQAIGNENRELVMRVLERQAKKDAANMAKISSKSRETP